MSIQVSKTLVSTSHDSLIVGRRKKRGEGMPLACADKTGVLVRKMAFLRFYTSYQSLFHKRNAAITSTVAHCKSINLSVAVLRPGLMKSPCKHTTCIPRFHVVSPWNTRGIIVGHVSKFFVKGCFW